jgi:hypothetical protein
MNNLINPYRQKSIKKKTTNYVNYWSLIFYLIPWLLVPKIIFNFWPISNKFLTLTGFVSILIVALSMFVFGKWFLLSKYAKDNQDNGTSARNGGNGGKPPWERILWTILMILISLIVYLYLQSSHQGSPTLFDNATLWSAVYGTIFGTFSYLKSDI